jgi:hypothetical protein
MYYTLFSVLIQNKYQSEKIILKAYLYQTCLGYLHVTCLGHYPMPTNTFRIRSSQAGFAHTDGVIMDNTLQVTLKNEASPRPFPRAAGVSLSFFPRAAFLACVSWKRASLARRFYVSRSFTVLSE